MDYSRYTGCASDAHADSQLLVTHLNGSRGVRFSVSDVTAVLCRGREACMCGGQGCRRGEGSQVTSQ